MKKYGQKAELQQALWKKLYKLCKNCNTDDGSKDWNATLGKDTTINTTHMIKNMGYTFFHFFHQPEIADKQKKKCADFIADKLSPSKVTLKNYNVSPQMIIDVFGALFRQNSVSTQCKEGAKYAKFRLWAHCM